MNTYQMRLLDFYFGVPICLLLDLYNKLLRPIFRLFRLKKGGEVKNILVMKYFGLGSIILSSPMIRALRNKYPQAKILFFTFDSNKEIIDMFSLADKVVTLRANNFFLFILDIIKAIFIFRKEGIDIAIDLEFFAKFSTIMTYVSGAPIRVGFYLRQMWRGNLLTQHVYYNPYHHIKEVFVSLAQAVEAPLKDLSISLPNIKKEDENYIDQLLARENILPQDKIICVNVNVSEMCEERRWPSANFARIIDELNQINAGKIIFIGSGKDKSSTNNVISILDLQDKVINLAGKLSLGQLAAIFKRTNLFITCDSGPLHLAVSLGTPTVSFFGPETPVLYGPIGEEHLVFYKNLYCSPCLNVYNVKTAMYGEKRCFEGENKCIQSISPEEVSKAIKEKFIDKWQK
ncbi:MAG: glycosyltransferase family 9 protein [Candidatus Omnitrophota bacterium]